MKKDIVGYEGSYLVTDIGEVISADREYSLPNGGTRKSAKYTLPKYIQSLSRK